MTTPRSRARLFALVVLVALAGCGETKAERLERYQKVAAEEHQWAGPAAVGLAASNAQDYEIAFEQWKPLAEAGNAEAQNFLGNMFFSGQWVGKDRAEAERWYRLAIAQGHVGAMENLALMYRKGTGVRVNANEAIALYEKAAATGSAWAALWAGEMYEETQTHGGESSAFMWYVIVVLLGPNDSPAFIAKQRQIRLAERMTPAQIREAEARAYEWRSRSGLGPRGPVAPGTR